MENTMFVAEDEVVQFGSLSNYCRICGNPHFGNVVFIFDEHGTLLQLSEKINMHLPITVSENDELPLLVCSSCVEKINIVHELIVSCIHTNKRFSEILHNRKREIQSVEVNSIPEARKAGIYIGHNINTEITIKNESPDVEIIKDEPSDGGVIKDESPGRGVIKDESPGREVIKDEPPDGGVIKDEPPDTGVIKDEPPDREVIIDEPPDREVIIDELPDREVIDDEPLDETGFEACSVESSDTIQANRNADFCLSNASDEEESNCRPSSIVLNTHVYKYLEVVHTEKDCETIQNTVSNNERIVQPSSPVGPLQCNTCAFVASSSENLTAHICPKVPHHKPIDVCCKICNKKFKDAYRLLIHKQTHVRGSNFPCPQCGKVFPRYYSLLIHQMGHFGTKSHQCQQCGKNQCTEHFIIKDHQKQHKSIHSDLSPFQCSICSVGFNTKENLKQHYKTHATNIQLMCMKCKACFPSLVGLMDHIKTHSDNKLNSLQCSVCNEVHTGEKPHQFRRCTKRLSHQSKFINHGKVQPRERHACHFCDKSFLSVKGKKNHERTHTGEGPCKCEQCGAQFSWATSLQRHMLSHTDHRQFCCEICNKLFHRRDALKVHMRTHTDERPFPCPVCGFRFRQKGDMLKHAQAHAKKAK